MKRFLLLLLLWACLALFCPRVVFANTVIFSSGRTLTGTVVRTNGDDLLLMMDHCAFNFSRAGIKEIKTEQIEATDLRNTNRLRAFKMVFPILASKGWATDLRPIPATVIDRGVLKNVPYISFRCGEDYEVNIYGDPARPSGLEVGVYRKLLGSDSAKSNCVSLVAELMGQPADREIVHGLRMEKDLKTRDGLTFEITPQSAEDAYMGWWVSVYSERDLNLARASDAELKDISIPKADLAKRENCSEDPVGWSAGDLKFARPNVPTITFTTKSGSVISNAEVRPYVEGVSLIWRTEGGSGGVVKLADLPDNLRTRFGYDPGKAASADAAEETGRSREVQARAAQATASSVAINVQAPEAQPLGASADGAFRYPAHSPSSSSGGSVYVNGYYRANGTYVHGYTRRQ